MNSNNLTVYLNMSEKKNDNPLPILYDTKDSCCGCSACYSACPVSAIKMHEDEEGFLYPEVYADLCINCYKCMKVCVFKVDQAKKKKE